MIAGTRAWVIAAGVACGLAFAGEVLAASYPGRYQPSRPGTWRGGSSYAPSWIVVEVMGPKGEISYETIQSSSPALQDRIAQEQNDYVKAVESWKKDKSQAAADKTKFEEKKPVPGYVKRVQTTPATFRSRDRAQEVALTLTRQMEERKKAKEAR